MVSLLNPDGTVKEEYLVGRAAGEAYAYSVCVAKGAKPCADMLIRSQCVDVVRNEASDLGCKCEVKVRDDGWAEVTIYVHDGILALWKDVVARKMEHDGASSPILEWAIGKLFGYEDAQVIDAAAGAASND